MLQRSIVQAGRSPELWEKPIPLLRKAGRMQLRFSLKGRLKLTAALRLQMGTSPWSKLLHRQQTWTSRLTLLLWACWRVLIEMQEASRTYSRIIVSCVNRKMWTCYLYTIYNFIDRCVSMWERERMLLFLEGIFEMNDDQFRPIHLSQIWDTPKSPRGRLNSLPSIFSTEVFFIPQ